MNAQTAPGRKTGKVGMAKAVARVRPVFALGALLGRKIGRADGEEFTAYG